MEILGSLAAHQFLEKVQRLRFWRNPFRFTELRKRLRASEAEDGMILHEHRARQFGGKLKRIRKKAKDGQRALC